MNNRMIKALEYLRSATNHPRLEIQQVQLLLSLYSADPKGLTMQDLSNSSGCAQSMVSRNAHAFGYKSQPRHTRLLGLRIDDYNPKYRIVYFLPEGRKIMATFVGIIEGTVDAPNFPQAKDKRTKTKERSTDLWA